MSECRRSAVSWSRLSANRKLLNQQRGRDPGEFCVSIGQRSMDHRDLGVACYTGRNPLFDRTLFVIDTIVVHDAVLLPSR